MNSLSVWSATPEQCVEALKEKIAHQFVGDVEKEADALHRFWQASNGYLTRFKEITDAEGKPIYDLEGYLTSRNMPQRFRRHFRVNWETHRVEENIKALPHEAQAPNNQYKNRQGARDLAREMGFLLGSQPNTDKEAYQLVMETLQRFHSSWYELNKEWVKGIRPERLVDELIGNQLTNVAPVLFRFEELMDKENLNHQKILRALKSRQSSLWHRFLFPFNDKPVGDAYLGLIFQKGFKPSLTPEIVDFFDQKIKKKEVVGGLIDVNASTLEKQAFWVQELGSEIRRNFGIKEDFVLKLPDTPPGSGAEVYLIRAKSDGHLIGALKIQGASVGSNSTPPARKKLNGLDELLSSLSVQHYLEQEKPNVEIAKIVDSGILNGTDYYTMVAPAEGKDLDGWLHGEHSAQLEQIMLSRASQIVGNLHSPGVHEKKESEIEKKTLDGIWETFKGNALYDVHWMRDFLDSDSLKQRAASLGVSNDKVEHLLARIKENVDAYEKDLDRNITLFRRTTTHGDLHGGNVFYEEHSTRTKMIDIGGLTWTIAKDNLGGTGDPGNDLGRLFGNFLMEDIKSGQYSKVSYDRLKSYYKKYLKAMKMNLNSTEELVLRNSVYMYVDRFFAIQCNDLTGLKFKSKTLSSSQLSQALLDAWFELDSQNWI